MSTSKTAPSILVRGSRFASIRRLFWVPLWISAGLVLVVLVGMLLVSWRSLDRLEPVEAHLAHLEQIQGIDLGIEQALLKGLRGTRISPDELDALRDRVAHIDRIEGALHPETVARLKGIESRLGDTHAPSVELLFESLTEIRQVLDGERERHDWLLTQIGHDSRTEIRLTLLLLLVGPLIFGISLFVVRVRVKQPLRALEELLVRLADRDYRPVPQSILDAIDNLAQPAFHSYNELVSRLQQLEAEHCDRERTLEQEVRRATEALLAQSRELGRAERLAAVGAVSAGLAHELRNPLAGIQMACSKLARALEGSEHAARIGAVNDELKRINHLLTAQVDAARHRPEPLETVAVDRVVEELLTLLRYQIPDGVEIASDVETDLQCLLPVAGLRQALLNLVLNAVQAMREEGRILIGATRDGGELGLTVTDTGPGFPEELLRAGIRPFATGRQGGTGLGLAMVRRFVRDHGGDLLLTNRSPHGAVVRLTLPCRPTDSNGGSSRG
ncbi:ATP-binding protein [Imhoffiella purpurea]|uniref:histidine kinase n=1 Tax=Imhoffiella purpurea TaxID=1249627 RepID=W9VEI2_9GAMM|nr:ATP-binding protein [Imhoffiella purpurea]EXJ15386.1 sensor histidine kinase [Imhoffiella purpurea]